MSLEVITPRVVALTPGEPESKAVLKGSQGVSEELPRAPERAPKEQIWETWSTKLIMEVIHLAHWIKLKSISQC
jgi:hypothetical protein